MADEKEAFPALHLRRRGAYVPVRCTRSRRCTPDRGRGWRVRARASRDVAGATRLVPDGLVEEMVRGMVAIEVDYPDHTTRRCEPMALLADRLGLVPPVVGLRRPVRPADGTGTDRRRAVRRAAAARGPLTGRVSWRRRRSRSCSSTWAACSTTTRSTRAWHRALREAGADFTDEEFEASARPRAAQSGSFRRRLMAQFLPRRRPPDAGVDKPNGSGTTRRRLVRRRDPVPRAARGTYRLGVIANQPGEVRAAMSRTASRGSSRSGDLRRAGRREARPDAVRARREPPGSTPAAPR